MNTTICPSTSHDGSLCFAPNTFPFYFSPKPALVAGISDTILTLAAPVLAYWSLSLFFHCLDISEWKWLDKYRIHESSEVKARNLATRSQVVWAVLFQQLIQTALGFVWLAEDAGHINHVRELRRLAASMEPILAIPGIQMSPQLLASAAQFVYWWGIPGFQFLSAMYEIICSACISF
jgi:sphinganine C4-monooxygenase